MKGFSGFGNSPASPLKGWKEKLKKGWDKATQIGMGLKEGAKEFVEDVPVGSRISDYPGQRTVEAAKRGYKKEKAHDVGGGGLGTYKKKKREENVSDESAIDIKKKKKFLQSIPTKSKD